MRTRMICGPLALCGLVLAGAGPARAQDGDAIAIVNGKPISKRTMTKVLMDGYGLQVMQQLIVLELAKEEAARLKLKVTAADIEAEYRRALDQMAPPPKDGTTLTEDEKRQSLEFMLQQKGISRAEFMLGMERNAYLRKVIERDFKVDEATLREEFARTYGEKVEVRHIQVGDVAGLHEALRLLEAKTDFAEVARQTSQNKESAARGGLLEPFAFNAPDEQLAPALREAAFAMQPGEVSRPIKVGRWWHILKLERRIPPADTQFADVRDQVEQQLRDRVIPERMNALVTDLFHKAQIRVLDNELKKKFEELLRKNAEAEAAARGAR